MSGLQLWAIFCVALFGFNLVSDLPPLVKIGWGIAWSCVIFVAGVVVAAAFG